MTHIRTYRYHFGETFLLYSLIY
uniref:Uncharacterized protein n=1 Tax=Anguilla anguilla TaxID=7936 RepID=A0A0E9QAV0_ANGAN